MPVEPTTNPYNFVPLGAAPQRSRLPGWLRIGDTALSGRLACGLYPLTPVFTADHQRTTKKIDVYARDMFVFLRNGGNKAILQGSTLKGMVRAVFETISGSCLSHAARSGASRSGRDLKVFEYAPLEEHGRERCNDLSALCPACRLFGVIRGDDMRAQGRVVFSDAVLAEGSLKVEEILLPELSAPKPHHSRIYSGTGVDGGPIAGRKYFYHYDPGRIPGVKGQGSPRAKWLAEYAPAGTRFDFSVTFFNLSRGELALLVRSLVLDEGLGHKVGMAKPAGFGSCRIEIEVEKSFNNLGGSRYGAWNRDGSPLEMSALKDAAGALPEALVEVLRLDKFKDGPIGYPSFSRYRSDNVAIDARGKYPFAAEAAAVVEEAVPPAPVAEKAATEQKKLVEPVIPPQPQKPRVKQGDKVQIEVTAKEGRTFHLRIIETEQEDFIFQSEYCPWKVGTRQRVRVAAVTADGQVKKINP